MIYDVNGNAIQVGLYNGVFPTFGVDSIPTIGTPTAIPTTFSDVYSLYDTLLQDVSHEKNLLGYGTNASGGQDTSLPIYEYVLLNPIEPNNPGHPTWAIMPAPKICLTSGIHGNERSAVIGLFNLVKAMVSSSDPVAKAIRNSAQYRIVPIVNPGGYTDNTRENRHGVNLNRNFGYNWGTGEHPGSAAYSEYESQALKAWCEAQAPTTLFMIDFHNHLASQTDNYFYIFTELERWKYAFGVVCRGMYDHFLAEGIDLADYEHFQEANTIAGIAAEFLMLNGVDAGGIETPNNPNNPTDNTWIKPAAEIDGGFIYYLLHNYVYGG